RMEEDPLLEGIHLLVWVDQGKLIIDSLKGLRNAGLLGGLLAVGILLLFLRRFSATILVGMAIPISVLSALAWLYLFDRELNVITLVALMLGVGMLVDTAVVVVESIVRISGSGARAHEAARRGTFEVATPIFAATLTSVIVFVPIFFGTPSQLTDYLTELGMVISLTLGSSLFVSLTLIPMVSARIYGGGDPGMGRWFAGVRAWYGRFLEVVLGHRALTLGVTAALIASVVIPFRLGFEVNLSDTTEITRNVSVFYQPQGQSLDYRAMEKIVDEVEAVLSPEKERLGIADIYSWYRDNFAWTSLYPGEEGVPEEELARIGDEVGKLLPEVPGVEIRTGDWGMYHGRRRGRSAGGTRVRVYGDSSALVDSTVERLRERFVGVEGVTDTEERQRESVGEIRVEPEEEKLSRFELSSRELSRRVAASFSGNMLREIRTESGDVGLRVQLAEEEKASVDELHDLRVALPGGGEVPLAEITSFEEGEGPKERHRENRRSSASFAVNFDASARPAMRSTVESVLGAYSWPRGYSYDLGEEWRHRMRNRSQFLEGILLAIFLVYLVMACLFESLRHPLALMVTVLLAIPGVAWGLFLWGDSLDQPASVGLILLAGIVVNNGIVFIDHVNRHRGQGLPVVAAIRRGGEERLRPILITALTTIIGLMPMAWGQANAAGIYYFTLSRAIICGLAASTFLTLIVLPVIYSLLAGRVRAAAAGGS
ncbi:MAG: efflux RND transporter permease subunit, partial [Planctomycetota bacterium]